MRSICLLLLMLLHGMFSLNEDQCIKIDQGEKEEKGFASAAGALDRIAELLGLWLLEPLFFILLVILFLSQGRAIGM